MVDTYTRHGCTVVLQAQKVWLWTGQGGTWVHGLTWLRVDHDDWQLFSDYLLSSFPSLDRTLVRLVSSDLNRLGY